MKFHRGQMFILATMLIAVYIVAMTASLTQFGLERTKIDREILNEPLLDSKREIQHFIELILAEYSKGGSLMTRELAISKINEFLSTMQVVDSARGVISEFRFFQNSFLLTTNLPPYENASEGSVYTSAVYGEFSLKITTLTSSISVSESFNITFIGRVEIQDNSVIIQHTRGKFFSYSRPASIYILNGTTPLFPTADPKQSGLYYFSSLSNLNNIGILNVTLSNGVYIIS